MDSEHDTRRSQETRRSREASFGSLMSDLTRDSTTLVRDEIDLAKAEFSDKISQLTTGIASIATAGAVLLSGFLVLLAAAVFGLNTVLPPGMTPWLSALIVGAVVVVIGLIMLMVGRKKLKTSNLMPEQTIASLRNDRNLAKQHDGTAKERLQ